MSKGFWTSTSDYGVVHRSNDQGAPSKTLLVFVHGLFGNCRRTWGPMPNWLLQSAAIEMDVISFSYPTKIWQRCSIALAADDLKTWLKTEFGGYKNILFVTHSTGGLVVKQMLCDEAPQANGMSETFDLANSQSLWIRARHVINIAVPHRGGAPFVTLFTKIAYLTMYPFIAPLLALLRFASQGKIDAGKNEILTELRWGNPQLQNLEKTFVDLQKAATDNDILSPLAHDLYAKSDLSVPIAGDSKQRDIYFRGTHKSVKIPRHASDPIVTIVSSMIQPYGMNRELEVVEQTLSRVALVDRATGTRSFIQPSEHETRENREFSSSASHYRRSGTQWDICGGVITAVNANTEKPRQIVVTGTGGVGKSVVLRRVAWKLGCEYLADPGNSTVLPIFIPLHQVTITDPSADSYSWDKMWQWWIHWTHALNSNQICDREWLEDRFQNHATVIIIDGLDDFLVNHPSIGLPTLVKILRDGANRYSMNSDLDIIAGIRSGYHGLERLASDSNLIYEVMRLSPRQAEQRYPSCRHWLSNINNKGVLDFVLTPLILSNFEPDTKNSIDVGTLSEHSIMEQTLRTILRRSGLIGFELENGSSAEIDDLQFALIILAWLFFYRHRGEIAITDLRDEARQIFEQWRTFFEGRPMTTEMQGLITGFDLIVHAKGCDGILNRTVFVASGPDMFRFSHRNWQEFLLAKYFVLCLVTGNVQDFGLTAFNSHIYRSASESFGRSTITASQIQNVLDLWKQANNTYITGNVIAFLAWGHTSIEAEAIELLLAEIGNYEALSRIVIIAGLGYRVLVGAKDDASVDDLRRILYPKLVEFAILETAPVDDRVASSLAWCYQKAFAHHFSLAPPTTPWPEVDFDDAQAVKALSMISTTVNGKRVLDTRSRSLQLAFLVPVLDAYEDPVLAIRAMHYLYYLVVARKYKVNAFELTQELPHILAEGSGFENIIKSFTAVPELLELYRRCQFAVSQ